MHPLHKAGLQVIITGCWQQHLNYHSDEEKTGHIKFAETLFEYRIVVNTVYAFKQRNKFIDTKAHSIRY